MRKTGRMARRRGAVAVVSGVVLVVLAHRMFGVYAPVVVATVASALVLGALVLIVAKHAFCRS